MASIPPPPDEPVPPVAPEREPAPPAPSSKTTILAIVASVAVIAILGVVLALANNGGDDGSATGSSSPSPVPVAAPHGVQVDASGFKVVVTWAPAEGGPVARYLVSRGGSVVARLDPDTTRWVDDDVIPETGYSYTVAAVGSDGTSATTRIVARTTTAPLATARLQGTFNVHIHATSHYGFSNFSAENGNLGWRLVPTCSKDPCDTKLTDLHQKDFRMTLVRSGASYHGTATVYAHVRCSGTPVASSFTIAVHLTDAGSANGRWVGTRIEGTMTQYESPQLGCVASGATFDVRGLIVR
jgi:hypothetical protein